MKLHSALLTMLGLFSLHALHAQPANNLCGSATVIPMTALCSPTSGTTLNATQSYPDACAGDPNDDVWFLFTATGNRAVIEVFSSPGFNAVVELWATPCSGQDVLSCMDETANGGYEYIQQDNLITGSTYLIRIYHYALGAPATSTFQVCVHAPPANDECSDAQSITMGSACNPVNGDAAWANSSSQVSGCQGNFNSNNDVWYSFTATSGDLQITVDGDGNASTGFDALVYLFGLGGCANLNEIACAHATGRGGTEVLTFQGIAPGNTYYIAVCDAANDPVQTTTFTICVQSLGGGIGMDEDVLGSADWSAVIPGNGRPAALLIARPVPGPTAITVLDATGRAVHRQSFNALAEGHTALDWVPTSAGVYLVRLEHDGEPSTTRVVVP